MAKIVSLHSFSIWEADHKQNVYFGPRCCDGELAVALVSVRNGVLTVYADPERLQKCGVTEVKVQTKKPGTV